jgi:hypothetical protein
MGNEITKEQCAAISRSIKLGEILIKDHSEIADLYREGMFAPAIAEKLDIQTEYGVKDNVAMIGVRYAISGHNGNFNLDSYVGLIPKEERERLGREHIQKNSRKGGRELYENKLGIFGRTIEQHSEDSRKAGRESAIAQGKTPWVMGRIPEVEYAHALSFLSEYRKGSKANNKLIALELNIEYHDCEEVRTAKTVQINLSKYRKSLENRV